MKNLESPNWPGLYSRDIMKERIPSALYVQFKFREFITCCVYSILHRVGFDCQCWCTCSVLNTRYLFSVAEMREMKGS